MNTQEQRANNANGKIEESIKELIGIYKSTPTLFLEEKQLHNEFDRIIKSKLHEEEKKIDIQFSTHESYKEETVIFPLIMNEYPTVNHYRRIKKSDDKEDEISFQEYYNETDEKGSPGSLDFVVLDKEWVKNIKLENYNQYNVAVNKDVDSRKLFFEKNQDSVKKSRFLVTVEFKYLHYGKYIKSWDELNLPINDKSTKSAIEKIIGGIEEDSFKQIREKSPFGHVVYFNSYIPINNDNLNQIIVSISKSIIEQMKKVKDEIGSETNLKVWFTQGGLPNRFKKDRYTDIPNEIFPILFGDNKCI